MPNYPDRALKEATHTDDVGYLYRANIVDSNHDRHTRPIRYL